MMKTFSPGRISRSSRRATSSIAAGMTLLVVVAVRGPVEILVADGVLALALVVVMFLDAEPGALLDGEWLAPQLIALASAVLPAVSVASLVGFGAVVAAMPAFSVVRDAVLGIGGGPLVSLAVATNVLAALTGSASGGMSIALAAMSDTFIASAQSSGIPLEVFHRVASMASGGMDTLPHNGAVITLLAVSGLTHRQSYGDIFAVTVIKSLAVFFVIAVHSFTGIV